MTSPPRGPLVAVAVLVAATALASLAFWLSLPSRLPTDDDWRRANELLQSRGRPGDVAIVAPAWAEGGRPFLTAMPVEAGHDLARGTWPGTKRQWLLALPDAPRFDLEEARKALAARGVSEGNERVGALWIEAFSIASPMFFSFTDEVATAEVRLGGARPEPCRWKGGMHRCPRGEWNVVREAWYEVEERPLRCLWAHPVGPEPLLVHFRDVPRSGRLVGRAALVGQAGARSGAPVDLAIELDGRVWTRFRFANRTGRQPFDVSLPPDAGKGDVTFAITTPNAGMRHFCFDAWVQPD